MDRGLTVILLIWEASYWSQYVNISSVMDRRLGKSSRDDRQVLRREGLSSKMRLFSTAVPRLCESTRQSVMVRMKLRMSLSISSVARLCHIIVIQFIIHESSNMCLSLPMMQGVKVQIREHNYPAQRSVLQTWLWHERLLQEATCRMTANWGRGL